MPETKQLQSRSIEKVSSIYEALRHKKPVTKKDLKNYIKVFLGVNIPDKKICAEHYSPMDYLWYTFRGSEFTCAWASSPCKTHGPGWPCHKC